MNRVPNPGYAEQGTKRTILRVVGVVCTGIALVLCGIAVADFFRAFGSEDFDAFPTKFWMFFVALPFFVVGSAGLNAGFMGAVARYSAGETMPVAKDSVAYLTDGEGVLGIGRTVDDDASGAAASTGPFCRSCGQRNDADAKFCDACGHSLA